MAWGTGAQGTALVEWHGRPTVFGNPLIEVCLWLREDPCRCEVDFAFVKVAEPFSEPRSVFSELRRDHRLVDDSPQRRETLVRELNRKTDPTEFPCEPDSLAALVETRFTCEEKRTVSALNALNVPSRDRAEPAFPLTAEEADSSTPRPPARVPPSRRRRMRPPSGGRAESRGRATGGPGRGEASPRC